MDSEIMQQKPKNMRGTDQESFREGTQNGECLAKTLRNGMNAKDQIFKILGKDENGLWVIWPKIS